MQQWRDGVPVLVQLLGDTRDYARHPERNRREEPEFKVARAACEALTAFDSIPTDVVNHVVDMVRRGPEASKDIELHAQLIKLIATADHSDIWSLLERVLQDDRIVGDEGENLYPVRYAAAWGLIDRLQARMTEWEDAPWTALEAAADHLDPQLAAPALIAIGLGLAASPTSSRLDALRGANGSEARRALSLLVFEDKAAAKSLGIQHELLPEGHPLWSENADDPTDASSRWSLGHAGRAWLQGLAGEDVEEVLRWLAAQRVKTDLALADFAPSALRRKKRIPITSFSELFGME